jgi:hypothetical protein
MRPLREEWQAEAVRLHLRYSVEIVEHYGLCPWAQRARQTGRTAVEVLLPPSDGTPAAAIEALERWAGDERIEVGFLLLPRVALSRVDFDAFVARVQEEASARHPIGQAPFALAAFHPDVSPDLGNAERLVPFLRRTPDPCIQAVRMSVLERVRSGTPQGTQFVDLDAILEFVSRKEELPLRERIARANLATVRQAGLVEVEARMQEILRDRDGTYRALTAREQADSAEDA